MTRRTDLPVADPTGLDERSLERVRALIHAASGIVLGRNKASMVRARLSKRLAATGCSDVPSYLDMIERPDHAGERMELVWAMTTNVTQFFREAHHFETLRALAASHAGRATPLRIWSAACSTGQEPYSIAMTLAEAGLRTPAARILATDIDRKSLARAAEGRFAAAALEGLDPGLRRRYFVSDGSGEQVVDPIRQMIAFRPLNLNGSWPFQTRFDAIFCRNVAIYFDAATQVTLWSRLIDRLVPGGWLFVGHSERLPDALLGRVTYAGQTSYQKTAAEAESA